jgi:sialic acid synthase SpsE
MAVLKTAKRLVDEAKKSGADCVNFNLISENIVSKKAVKGNIKKDTQKLTSLNMKCLNDSSFLLEFCRLKQLLH